MIVEEADRLQQIIKEAISEVLALKLEEEDENEDLEVRRIKIIKGCVRGRGRGGRIPKMQLTFQEEGVKEEIVDT